MGDRLVAVLASLAVILIACSLSSQLATSEQIHLSSIMPKLQAIHEDAKNLLLKNSELKGQIQAGVKLQASQHIKKNHQQQQQQQQQQHQQQMAAGGQQQIKKIAQPAPGLTISTAPQPHGERVVSANGAIDYVELEEFNVWVDVNLDYAVRNTRASIDALREEAQQNNGTIEYSEQAVQDGIEGVRYWRSAVLFQDKTLKNEKFVVDE